VAELKTRKTQASVSAFLDRLADSEQRRDCRTLLAMMQRATGVKPKMWGTSIVGFGDYHYKYASGREADWFVIGFSPRKRDLTLYIMSGIGPHAAHLRALGKHKTGVGCLYLKRLADVDPGILEKLIVDGVKQAEATRRERIREERAPQSQSTNISSRPGDDQRGRTNGRRPSAARRKKPLN
jgi:hypothetical protein